ncbi:MULTISPECIES: S10 family serine carboxypeptidase-like protein [unclassified Bradyrhizobium]|uniref:S10 family peptidase n=1 Tax=unclassified Bradyrhizobium TaxID=2631580 RepID=UPI0028E7E34D|nr:MULTISPECIES: peptidase S10 [unclassified Bradyrhizobium]
MAGSRSSVVWSRVMALTLTALLAGQAVYAQDAPPAAQDTTAPGAHRTGSAGNRAASPPSSPSAAEQHKLPADSTTTQKVELPDRTLSFTATAGSIRLFDDKSEPQADIAYTSYQLDGADRASRPVTFFFNGGPGASSAYLQLGNAGPWRIGIDAASVTPSSKPELMPNADTWLDFTDLVFIDPVGTGYSRFVATGDEVRKRFFSVDGDVRSLSLVVRRWLEKHDRLASPKFITAESYGGIRGPKIVNNLQHDQGIGISGLILLSPLMDFRDYSGSSLMQYVASLPSYAAVAKQVKGPVTRADLADVERYASGDFLLDLVKGEADTEATNRLADRVASLTGIDQAVSRRLAGRFDVSEFRREFDRKNGRIAGRYDGSVLGIDPYPDSSRSRSSDPSGDVLTAPLTSAAVELTRRLSWHPDGSYELLSGAVNRSWDFGRSISPPESTGELRQILALDPKLKLLVGHGLFDLATPYYGSKILLDQLPAFARPPRVKLVVYPGGHMFYSRDDARKAFRGEAEAMMKEGREEAR